VSVAEIKKTKLDLIAWIEGLSDTNMLTFLDGLRNSKPDKDWWDDLTIDQQRHIEEGLSDAENGRTVSSQAFWNKLKNG
jgi:predicted transcriptional regulator